MSIHDAAQFVGRFCEITTNHGKLFEITAIEPLPDIRQ
jgi:hypothetical protein